MPSSMFRFRQGIHMDALKYVQIETRHPIGCPAEKKGEIA